MHYGIKGMRWGIRRSREWLARNAAARAERREASIREGQNKAAAERVKQSRLSTRVETLSAEDLKKRVERLRLEKEYQTIVRELYPKGQSKAQKILGTVGDKMLTELSGGAAKALSRSLFGSDQKNPVVVKPAGTKQTKPVSDGSQTKAKSSVDTGSMTNDELIDHLAKRLSEHKSKFKEA